MAVEIERKFLIKAEAMPQLTGGQVISQGYLPTSDKTVVRARIKGEQAFLTVKGENKGVTRSEFEYPIPVADAQEMIASLCAGRTVEKTRYLIPTGVLCWEVDVFRGDNEGLIIAEIELSSEEQTFVKPGWLGSEVSDDPKYYNSNLLNHPFRHWT